MPGDLPELGGGWLAAIATGLGVGGTAIYKAYRQVKGDVGDDRDKEKTAARSDAHIAHLTSEIERLTTELKTVASEVKELIKEKSELVAAAAKAQAEALIWQSKVETLEADVAELKTELENAEALLIAKDDGRRRRATDFVDDRDKRELK